VRLLLLPPATAIDQSEKEGWAGGCREEGGLVGRGTVVGERHAAKERSLLDVPLLQFLSSKLLYLEVKFCCHITLCI